jgi:hypothetical protein
MAWCTNTHPGVFPHTRSSRGREEGTRVRYSDWSPNALVVSNETYTRTGERVREGWGERGPLEIRRVVECIIEYEKRG